MFVLCVVSTDKRQNAGQSRQRNTYGRSTNRVQENAKKNPGRDKKFYLLQNHPDLLWGTPSLLFSEYRVSFVEVKVLGHEGDHLCPPTAVVNNE
jgi:hypothetical protein